MVNMACSSNTQVTGFGLSVTDTFMLRRKKLTTLQSTANLTTFLIINLSSKLASLQEIQNISKQICVNIIDTFYLNNTDFQFEK